MLHTTRDFKSFTGATTNFYLPYFCALYAAIFCRTTLGYTTVGQTNFNIDATPLRLGTGSLGSLNQGGSDTYAFIPDSYTVSGADINRILCLRSPANGMVNSGLFRVASVDVTRNYLYVDYRSPDVPPAETGMTWALYENESVWGNTVIQTGGNGIVNTYQSQGSANCSRLILQSPSPMAWQLRICLDTSYDTTFQGGAVTPSEGSVGAVTYAPGFSGSVAGDFPVGGNHLHTPLFFNKHDSNFGGMTVGWFPSGNGQTRNFMWGDDVTGDVFAASRAVFGGSDSFAHWGQPENEQTPLPPHNVQRLFAMGATATGNNGANGIYWASGYQQNQLRGGCAFGLSGQPISCIYSIYNSIAGRTFSSEYVNNVPLRSVGTAMDNPYTHLTELLPVDLLAGTFDYTQFSGGPEVFILEHRRLGTAPIVRFGPSRIGYFQPVSDPNRSWLHLNDGIYLPWQGSIVAT